MTPEEAEREQRDYDYFNEIRAELKSRYQDDIEKMKKSDEQRKAQFYALRDEAKDVLRPFLKDRRGDVLSYLDEINNGKAKPTDEFGYILSLKSSKEIDNYAQKVQKVKPDPKYRSALFDHALRAFNLMGYYAPLPEGTFINLRFSFSKSQILPKKWSLYEGHDEDES